jgi:cellulose synthase/poly-beta-1,6-N-acetylglucosamine synthase-like glycosyltransferase
MDLISIVADVFLWTLFGFLLLNGVYLLFFSIAGKLYQQLPLPQSQSYRRFGVLMPAYRNDSVILSTAVDALEHQYAGEHRVIVIADSLLTDTTMQLRAKGVEVHEIKLEKRTKGKALQWVTELFSEREFDAIIILDVDNVMEDRVLEQINDAFEMGYKIVQAHRTSFKAENSLTFLDACNEEINNNIYRRGPARLGLSSALIGSGMAFDFNYFRKLIVELDDTVGEDKELDFKIALTGEKIVYLDKTIVKDEKISGANAFRIQRARWLAAQWSVLKKYSPYLLSQLAKGNVQFLNKLAQAWLVPRMLLLGTLFLLVILSLLVHVGPSFVSWLIVLAIVSISMLVSLPLKFYKEPLFLKALWKVPQTIVLMIIALFGVHKAGKRFIATEHRR